MMSDENERLVTLESDVRHIREVVDRLALQTERVIRTDERVTNHAADIAELKPRVDALERGKWKTIGFAAGASAAISFIGKMAGIL
jgi:hypothetical protein